jgi:hypothetical protein
VRRESENGQDDFDYKQCVARFKERFPDLPVLLYGWTRFGYRTPRTGGVNYDELLAHPEWLLRDNSGKLMLHTNEPLERVDVNITAPGFRLYVASRTAEDIARFGTDGIAFDMNFHEFGPRPSSLFQNGNEIARAWPATMAGSNSREG